MSSTRSSATASHRSRTEETPRALLVNVRQAAEILSLSRSSIYLLVDAGKLTPIRIGRSVRFSVGHLEDFVGHLIAESRRC
jgi:excisionase family DNA binding protein